MVLSAKTSQLQPSGIRRMFNRALQYENAISFTLGEPNFTASDNVVGAACRAIALGWTKYTENAGILPLRQAIAGQLKGYGLDYSCQGEIVVTVGAMEALYLSLKALLNPGDQVLVPTPCWTNYLQQVQMCDGVPVCVQARQENGFMVTKDQLQQARTPKTRAILLNSPCNPTGAVYSRQALEEIAAFARENDLTVLSDEVYKMILFDGSRHVSIASLPGMKERTVVIDSFSKGYAMTGWRVGYAAGPEPVVAAITRMQENVAACAATPAQYAALEAVTGSQEYTADMVRQYQERRDYLVERVNAIEGLSCLKPKGTFYAFIDITPLGVPSQEFADRLLEQEQVVVVPGSAFGPGGDGFIRISYATSMETIREGMDRLERFAASLQG